MLNHLTLLKFNSATTDTDIDDLAKTLDTLPNSIVEIQMLELGRNVVSAPTSYDFAVWALFANEQTLDRYLQHPEYVAAMEKIQQMTEHIVTVAFYGSDAGILRDKPPVNWVLGDDFADL